MSPDPIGEARAELLGKSRQDIERETAFKWAARAVAAYQLSQEVPRYSVTGVQPAQVRLLQDATHYLDEACEHAALADRTGAMVRSVCEWVRQYVPPGAI